jgi:nitrogen-specific signal transduction histidine kinase
MAQRIVTEHGGRIDVESRPGQNVFTIVLPQRGG